MNSIDKTNILDDLWDDIEKFGWKVIASKKDYYKDKLKRYHYPQSEGKIKSEIIDLLLQSILKDETIHQAVVKINNYRNE